MTRAAVLRLRPRPSLLFCVPCFSFSARLFGSRLVRTLVLSETFGFRRSNLAVHLLSATPSETLRVQVVECQQALFAPPGAKLRTRLRSARTAGPAPGPPGRRLSLQTVVATSGVAWSSCGVEWVRSEGTFRVCSVLPGRVLAAPVPDTRPNRDCGRLGARILRMLRADMPGPIGTRLRPPASVHLALPHRETVAGAGPEWTHLL